jgi:hypothetical protein
MLQGNKILLKFLKHVLLNQLPKDKQETCGTSKNFWSADFWTIELCKCLYLDNQKYEKSRLPKWLHNKQHQHIQEILIAYEIKNKMFQELIKVKNDSNNLLICEVSHGIDILVSLQIKKWDNIYCYDQVNLYGPILQEFFQENYNLKPIFFSTSSYAFNLNQIQSNDYIVISNQCTSLKWPETYIKFLNNEKTIHLIRDGILEK